jgi:hypothetical protein
MMLWNVKKLMPMGNSMAGTSKFQPVTSLTAPAKKPRYLNTASDRRLSTIAAINRDFRRTLK